MTSVSGAIRQTPRWLIWVGFVLFAMATIAFLARGQWTWFSQATMSSSNFPRRLS